MEVVVDVVEFERLFRNEYPRLVRSLTLVCGDREVAADVVQDAFVQAHRHWCRVASYDDPATWVRRVAINRAINHHRGVRRLWSFLDRAGRTDHHCASTLLFARPAQTYVAPPGGSAEIPIIVGTTVCDGAAATPGLPPGQYEAVLVLTDRIHAVSARAPLTIE